MEIFTLKQSVFSRAKQETYKAQKTAKFMWGGEGALAVTGGTWLTKIASDSANTLEMIGRAVGGSLSGLLAAILAIFIWNLFTAPYKQRNEARNIIGRYSSFPFYLKYDGFSLKRLSLPPEPYKRSLSFNLIVSNKEDIPRSVSKFILETELENGSKKRYSPVESDNETEANISLYLQPNEAKTVWLNFVYDAPPINEGEKLYVFDDSGAYARMLINIDTMVNIVKKSESRSGDYQPL